MFFVGEGEVPILCAAFGSLIDLIVRIFAAVPVIHSKALVGVVNLRVASCQIPRLQVYCRVIDPDFRFDCSPINLLPDLHCLHLLALLGLVPAHRAFHELIGVDDQLLAVPETNGVAVIKGITILRWRVTATIGINPPDIVDSLGRQPGLLRPDDELPQERNNQPTRKAQRTTVAEIHVVPDAGSLDFSAFFYGLRSRRRKLPKYALRSTSEKRA